MTQPQKPPKEALPNIAHALRFIIAELVQIHAKEKEKISQKEEQKGNEQLKAQNKSQKLIKKKSQNHISEQQQLNIDTKLPADQENILDRAKIVKPMRLKESKPLELPPLLSAKHIMQICSCSRTKAYDIMNEPHRPVWQNAKGELKRLHRDTFLEQLKQESIMNSRRNDAL